MRTCTGVAVGSSTPAHRGGDANTQARSFTVWRKRRALGGAVEVHSVDMDAANHLVALEDAVLTLKPTIIACQQRHRAYKYQIALNVLFHKALDPTILIDPPVTLRTTMTAVYTAEMPQLVETSRQLLELLEVYEQNGSGWFFRTLFPWNLEPIRASVFVPPPKWIRDKRDVTNIIGTGDDCLKWAVLASLQPAVDNPSRMENYWSYVDLYDFSSLSFPVPLSAVTPFAKRNGISVNVYAVEDGKRVIFPLCVTYKPVEGKHVDLLMYEANEIQHYSTICNFSRLINGQLNNHQHAVYSCKKCLHACSSADVLERHMERCMHVQLSKFPKDTSCKFTNIQKQLQASFGVYADFESILKPLSNIETTQGVEEEGEPPIVPYQEHIACSFSYKIICSGIPDFNKPIVWYREEDAADEFVRVVQRKQKNFVQTILKLHRGWNLQLTMKLISNMHRCAIYASKFLWMTVIV